MHINIISLVISCLTLIISITLFLVKLNYENPKIKNIIWVYNAVEKDFPCCLKDFRNKCDYFLKNMSESINDNKTLNKEHSIRIIKKNTFYYPPYILKTKNGELSILVEYSNGIYIFYVVTDINKTPKRINKKLPILYKNNEWERNFKK